MRIRTPEISEADCRTTIQTCFEHAGAQKTLWFSVPKEYGEFLTTTKLDGFVVGLLLLAMKSGEDMVLEGAVSQKLYYNLTHYYTEILRLALPSLKPVRIVPKSLDDGRNSPPAGGVATGFSAGIDSFAVVFDHLVQDVPSDFRITHFLFNNVGSHGDSDAERASRLFHERYDLIKGYPESIDKPFITIDSNLSDVLQMDFQQTHVPRNVSAVLMLQGLFSKYYYASTYRYRDCYIGKTYDMAYTDPSALHLLSTESLECIATGSQMSRVEKTRRVAQVDGANRWLNVCATETGGENCSACWKCNRTLLTLELLGLLSEFDQVFDLSKWEKAKHSYVTNFVLRNPKDPLVTEILEYAHSTGQTFPLRYRAEALLRRYLPTPSKAKRALSVLRRSSPEMK